MKRPLVLLLFALLTYNIAFAQKVIKAKNAHKYLGKIVTVRDTMCKVVMSSSYAWIIQICLGQDADRKRLLVTMPYDMLFKSKTHLISVTGLIEGTKENPYITVKDTSKFRNL